MSELDYIPLSLDLQQALTTEQAWHYRIVPKEEQQQEMHFYADDSRFSDHLLDELEILFGKRIRIEKKPSGLVERTLGKYYRKNQGGGIKTKQFTGIQSDDFLQNLILEAKELGSSDIHIEAYEEKCRIRFRMDGLLVERYNISRSDYPTFINKIKIKSNLDIAEKRLPQDGRIFFQQDALKFDIRVSVLPSLHGEKIVMRLLSNDATNIEISSLGFGKEELDNYLEGIKKPHGILLISGPTGSGKTTTLYATLKILNKVTSNVVTIEDPIEYTLEGINQVQLKENIGLTFASALRTFLRQDPDVIMLGEIRDGETAQMAVRAALTGHLVLSTIHTNSAWGTITRLVDMGIPPFLISGTLNTTVAQRLVRLLCPHCKQEEPFDKELYPRQFKAPGVVNVHYTAKGCEYCHYTGYKGRKAVYEVIPVDYDLSEKIKAEEFNVTDLLKERGIRTLSDNAFELFKKGDTSIDEIYSMLIDNHY